MKAPSVITVDFETEGIQARPTYPPKPVGVAVKYPGKKAEYFAWGHPAGNNISKAAARDLLKDVWADKLPKLFHNGKFDIDVGEDHLGLARLHWEQYHDTMFLAFLDNPDRANVKLKDVAEEVIGKAPSERDALREWILRNVAGAKKSDWGAYICRAPGTLVAKYAAQGDADSTAKLFNVLWPNVEGRGMLEAYDRERRIVLPLLDSERRGIRVDMPAMEKEGPFYEALLLAADEQLRKLLKSPDLDLDKRGTSLADALDEAGLVENWTYSEAGNRLTNKKVLMSSISNKGVLALLFYRNALATSLRTFHRPWLHTARASKDGRIFTQWNQVRQAEGGDPFGARTGRLSSSPNFQNIPIYTRSVMILPRLIEAGYMKRLISAKMLRDFPWINERKFTIDMPGKGKRDFNHACPLPMMKGYLLPEKGDVFIERDYSQQEFRILAHFEDGALLQKYQENPDLDVHDAARDLIHGILGVMLDRRPVKDVGFSLIYGMGLGELARKTEVTVQEAKEFKSAYLQAMPGIKILTGELKMRAATDEPIITWGKRQYFVEPPRFLKKRGRVVSFDYKLINRLIQGSAADCTKESLARYAELSDSQRHGGKFTMCVHDSNVISAPKKHWKAADKALKDCMESVEFDVFMKSDGKIGDKNLGDLKKIVDK